MLLRRSIIDNALIIEFPLRGEWLAVNTPAKRIPSHGTDMAGQRYAYDFLMVDSGKRHFKGNIFKYLFWRIPIKNCYCWGKEIYAPCDGTIIAAKDGLKERPYLNFFKDIVSVLKNGLFYNFEKNGVQPIAGNYIVMECRKNIYAFFAHFKEGSITVKPGERIKKGYVLGKVGHSGNSTAPHLHFHLMNSPDFINAQGIPCAFKTLEVFKENQWQIVSDYVPDEKNVVRFIKKI